MKKKKLFRFLIPILILTCLIPIVYAFMFRKSQDLNNQFKPAQVSCVADENMIVSEIYDSNGDLLYKENRKDSITVQNTSNVDAYLRVTLVFYWEDSKGNVVAKGITPPSIPTAAGWLADTESNRYTYYYQYPVAPGTIVELLAEDSYISMRPVNEIFDGVDYIYYPVLEIIAEAIQSVPVSAVQDSWDVTITPTTVDGVTTYPITSTQAPKK